jgi:CRISPR-associated exonuclease Cas4
MEQGFICGLVAAAVALMMGVLVLAWAGRVRARTGLPAGRVLLSDMSEARRGKPMYSRRYRLSGTPDYVLATPHGPVPVEVKPNRVDDRPLESHRLQVLAYCLLIEETEGRRPPYGLLRYSNNTYTVNYDEEARTYLISVLEEMLRAWSSNDVPRNHEHAGRCRACAYRRVCEQSLYAK